MLTYNLTVCRLPRRARPALLTLLVIAVLLGLPLSAAAQDLVRGIQFQGTVSGVSDDPEGMLASDLEMRLTAPSGDIFLVGGDLFSGNSGAVEWEFQDGSNSDGTYVSNHPTAFNSVPLTGLWTARFRHDYSLGSTMSWTNVTVALRSAEGAVLATLEVPDFTIEPDALISFDFDLGQQPPLLVVTENNLEFGQLAVGSTAQLVFFIQNEADEGAANLVLDTLAISGNEQFAIRGGTCEAGETVLAPGAPPCSVEVRFEPTEAGAVSGLISIEASGQAAQVNLSGEGFRPDELFDDRFQRFD